MSSRTRVKKYGLFSQRKILQFEAERMLREKGLVIDENYVNCLFLYNKKESLKHFLVKAIIFKILRERGRRIACEVEIKNGIVDLLDLDNLIAYEIESDFDKKKIERKVRNYKIVNDVIFINLREVPNEFKKAEKFLRKIVI